MVTMTAMTGGRTGFISDPVIDTATRQIIYAHCVASNRAFGPQGEANPFQILTHSEDRQGASLRSMLPLGYMTTTVEFAPERKTILFHQGKAVENVDGRPGLPHEAGRRARRRHREALHRVGSVGLAPRHVSTAT